MEYKLRGFTISIWSDDMGYSKKAQNIFDQIRMLRAGIVALDNPALSSEFYSRVAPGYSNWLKNKAIHGIGSLRDDLRCLKNHQQRVLITHNKSGKAMHNLNCGELSQGKFFHNLKRAVDAEVENIRRERRARQMLFTRTRRVGDVTYTTIGNMVKDGELRRIVEMRKAKLVYEPKRPLTMERHVGIELEFISPVDRDSIAIALTKAGVARYVQIKGDGSISTDASNPYGHELVICVPESKRKEVISAVSSVLRESSAKVNKSCGFHVHIDMRTREREKAFANLVCSQNILYAMNPVSRRNNQYCRKTPTKDFAAARHHTRYRGINAASYSKYTTLEVRIHAGTVDERKISNWVDILIAVADADSPFVRSPRSVESFCKGYKVGRELQDYIAGRVALFAGPVEQEASA